MKQGCLYISAFILLMLAGIRAGAQVSIRATADRDKILIGEPVSVSVEAYVPLGSQVGWFKSDTIDHFDIIKRSAIDTTEGIDGKKITQVLTMTSFDSGRWNIPPFNVNVGGKPYYSDSLALDVAFISFDPKEDYHDIKGILVVEDPALKYVPWIITAVAVVSLALIIFLWKRVKKVPALQVSKPQLKMTAYEDAMRSLAALRQQAALTGNEKAFYSEMNDILRKYVFLTFGVTTLERTNEEFILQLAAMNLPQKPFSSLVQSLRIGDFVKFAKYRPSGEDNISNIDIVRSSVDLLNNYSGSAV